MRYWPTLAPLVAIGCSGGTGSWWPLREGLVQSYSLERGATTLVADWKVTGRAPVGAASGYVFWSPVGESVLAWQGGSVVASKLAGTLFEPPIPMLVHDKATWRGTVVSAGKAVSGSAVITGKPGEGRHPVFGVRTFEVEVRLQLPGGQRVVESVFADRVGLVSQSQRTDDILDYRLTLLGSG